MLRLSPNLTRVITATALLLVAMRAEAALTADVNLDRLRQAPEAADVQARLDALIPPQAQERLALLAERFGCDPRRDLHRIVVSVPDNGAPTIRLIGLPAEAIAAALAMKVEGQPVLGGLTGYPLPNRPNALLVALGPDDALIGRADLLAKESSRPATLPPSNPQVGVRLRVVPGPHPRVDAMTLVSDLELVSDGMGSLSINANAHDEPSALELVKRYDALREVSASSAAQVLPGLQRMGKLLAVTTLQRDGEHLALNGTIPAELRHDGIDRMLNRLEDRMGRRDASDVSTQQRSSGSPGQRPERWQAGAACTGRDTQHERRHRR